jgi:outer membrane lipoprotein-sorting protein
VGLAAVALLTTGLLRLPGARGAAILISAVEAMEDVTSVHSWGRLTPPFDSNGLWLGEHSTQEVWLSPDGWRWDLRDPDGSLCISRGASVESGSFWWYEPEQRRAVVFSAPTEQLASHLRRTIVNGGAGHVDSQGIREEIARAEQISTSETEWNGRDVIVVSLRGDLGLAPPVAAFGEHEDEFYVDAETNLWLGERAFVRKGSARTLVADHWVEYNADIPAETFQFAPAEGTAVHQMEAEPGESPCNCQRLPWWEKEGPPA